jgi:hypothetical protein
MWLRAWRTTTITNGTIQLESMHIQMLNTKATETKCYTRLEIIIDSLCKLFKKILILCIEFRSARVLCYNTLLGELNKTLTLANNTVSNENK